MSISIMLALNATTAQNKSNLLGYVQAADSFCHDHAELRHESVIYRAEHIVRGLSEILQYQVVLVRSRKVLVYNLTAHRDHVVNLSCLNMLKVSIKRELTNSQKKKKCIRSIKK
jgi:hypothetical protein